MDKYGELAEPNSEEHIGYQAVGVKGYDVRDILDSEAVESYDLRSHYGAYIEGHPAMEYGYEQDVNSGEKQISGSHGATMSSGLRFRGRNRLRWSITRMNLIPGDGAHSIWRFWRMLPAFPPIRIICPITILDLTRRNGLNMRKISKN